MSSYFCASPKINSPTLITHKTTHLLKRMDQRGGEKQRLLAYLPKVNLSVISLIGNRELAPLITPALLAEIAFSETTPIRRLLDDEVDTRTCDCLP
jgi:hypothetical protein